MQDTNCKRIMCDDFMNLRQWSDMMSGALQLLSAMEDAGMFDRQRWKGDEAVYRKAEVEYLKGGKSNIERFIIEWRNGKYRNHQRDKKGRLLSCEFYIENDCHED